MNEPLNPDAATSLGNLLAPLPGRGFSARPVPRVLIDEILGLAARAPSGVNMQPWNVMVLTGAPRARLLEQVLPEVPVLVQDAARRAAFWQAFDTHPLVKDWGAHDMAQSADSAFCEAMAQCVSQPAQAEQALARYFRFSDAPVGLFFTLHDQLGIGSVLDTGMFTQNIVLAAKARGLRATVQTGWRGVAGQVLASLEAPPSMWVVCGMALGFDAAQPAADAGVGAGAVEMQNLITWHG